jgi:hypothetical protein
MPGCANFMDCRRLLRNRRGRDAVTLELLSSLYVFMLSAFIGFMPRVLWETSCGNFPAAGTANGDSGPYLDQAKE